MSSASAPELRSLGRVCFVLCLVGAALSLNRRTIGADETTPVEIKFSETKSGVRFGLYATKRSDAPAPTLFVFASSIETTLGDRYYRQCGNFLVDQGYVCVSVDLPRHGKLEREGESNGLSGWRFDCDHESDFVAFATARFREVLDHLIESKVTDPKYVAACGTSRGGFMALHFAAADPRVRCVAAFAPVTDLAMLSEFKGADQNPLVQRLSIERHAEKLAGRAVWVSIGDRDARVSTDRAIQFVRRVTEVSLSKNISPLAELHVLAEPKGHTTPARSPERAAEWILKMMSE